MGAVKAAEVQELRQRTGAGMMDCKKALQETSGDLDKAIEFLRKKGISSAEKKAGREAKEGAIVSYIHGGGRIGVLVEVNCETDFVARNEKFKDFTLDLAMQVAAANPLYVDRESVPAEVIEKEKEIFVAEAKESGKPEQVIEKIVSGKIDKWLGEICLMEQKYIKDPDTTVGELLKQQIATLGENMKIARFSRFELGGE